MTDDIKLQKAKESARRTIEAHEFLKKYNMPIPKESIELFETVEALYDRVIELESVKDTCSCGGKIVGSMTCVKCGDGFDVRE